MTGYKKESMFKAPEDVKGKVRCATLRSAVLV